MRRRRRHLNPPAPAARGGIGANLEYPVLPIGTTLPDFNLPGVDGKTHKASEYSGKAIAIVFESNHCPVSQLYEGRIEKLYADYKNKGVTLVAINPNNPKTGAPRRARLHRRDRLAAGDEAAGAVSRHRLALPLRRRHAGRVDEVRRRRHAAHLHLRRAAQAALPGTDRRQPA
jgi:thiol-disulfide isomerase/thioredoxin